jgi:2-amino-4-hydroxy-6-hydroxymethyldihydropteridine diphosphokinase
MLETRPWGNWGENPIAQEDACASRPCVEHFINAAVCFELSQSAFTPHQILAICKQVESELGRVEKIEYDAKGERVYHSRPIDIDILLWGDLLLDTSDLKIPHPLMWERDFVLTPLAEIADETLKLKIIKNKKL